jgi:hypothetical protein
MNLLHSDAPALAEFQLTELEARLEMASLDMQSGWCCECFMNPFCPSTDPL